MTTAQVADLVLHATGPARQDMSPILRDVDQDPEDGTGPPLLDPIRRRSAGPVGLVRCRIK